MKNLYLFTFIILTFFTNCHSPQKSKEIQRYNNYINTINTNENNKLFIFVPLDMCSTCFTNFIEFINTIESNKIFVVFVGKTKKDYLIKTRKITNKEIAFFAKFSNQNIFINKSNIAIVEKTDNKIFLTKYPENNAYKITKKINEFLKK